MPLAPILKRTANLVKLLALCFPVKSAATLTTEYSPIISALAPLAAARMLITSTARKTIMAHRRL